MAPVPAQMLDPCLQRRPKPLASAPTLRPVFCPVLGGWGAPHSKTAPRPPQPRAPPPPWKRLLLTPEAPADPQPAGGPPGQTPSGPPGDPLFREPTPLSASSLRCDPRTGMRQEPLLRRSPRIPGTWIVAWHVTGAVNICEMPEQSACRVPDTARAPGEECLMEAVPAA